MGMPIIPDLNAFGAVPAERAFRDDLIAREAHLVRTTCLGGLAAFVVFCAPLLLLVFNALLLSCGDPLRGNAGAPVIAALDVAIGYARVVGPWLPVVVGSGVVLAWLRRYCARHGHHVLVPMGPTHQMRFSLHSIPAILFVPVVLWSVAERLDVELIVAVAFPLWLFSGLAIDVAWESVASLLLRRFAPLPRDLALSMTVHEVLRMERDLVSVKIRNVTSNASTGGVYVSGEFEDKQQLQRVQQCCRKVVGVERVQVGSVSVGLHDQMEGERLARGGGLG